jgi:hypothetical protein
MDWNRFFIARYWGTCLSAVIALIVVAGMLPMATAEPVNVIKGIGVAASRADVEIELESATEFPVRDELVVLRIGSREFTRSRYPEDGTLNRLIFVLPFDEFARLQPGETVTVEYGRKGTGPRWNFGQLTRSLLGK